MIHDEHPGNQSVTIVGQHLGLTIATTPNVHYLYWEGMEPLELFGYDSRLVAYLLDLPYQEGIQLSPIREEGTELVELTSDNSVSTDHHIFMVQSGHGANGPHNEERLEDIEEDKLSANAGQEDEA